MMTNAQIRQHLWEEHNLREIPNADGGEEAVRLHHRLHVNAPASWVHGHQFENGMAHGEEQLGATVPIRSRVFTDLPIGAPKQAPPKPPLRRHIQVVWHDGHWERFPVSDKTPWRVNNGRRVLVVGHGVPRVEIPLDTVRFYSVEVDDDE